MHDYRIVQVYITLGIATVLLGFWIYLIFNFNRKRFIYLTLVTILTSLPLILYKIKENSILEGNKTCIEQPIILRSYYGKENAVLFINRNFTYDVFYDQSIIKTGSWDAYADSCKSIIFDESGRLFFEEFKVEQTLNKRQRNELIRNQVGL